jgi:hypothetical protein
MAVHVDLHDFYGLPASGVNNAAIAGKSPTAKNKGVPFAVTPGPAGCCIHSLRLNRQHNSGSSGGGGGGRGSRGRRVVSAVVDKE